MTRINGGHLYQNKGLIEFFKRIFDFTNQSMILATYLPIEIHRNLPVFRLELYGFLLAIWEEVGRLGEIEGLAPLSGSGLGLGLGLGLG